MTITAEQVELRKTKLGASDVPAALGISPYKTKARLWAEKTGRVTDEVSNQMACDIGNAIEPLLGSFYERFTGRKVVASPTTRQHAEHEFFVCHVDLIDLADRRPVELKNVGSRMGYKWGPTGDPEGVPLYVAAQCAAQALVCGVDYVYVGALIGGTEFRNYKLDMTPSLKTMVMDGVIDFWGHVECDECPEVTVDDLSLMKSLYEPVKGESVTATKEIYQKAMQLVDLKRSSEILNEQMDQLKLDIQTFMEGREILVDAEGYELFTWKQSKASKKTDWKGVVEFNQTPQNVIEQFTKVSPGNRPFVSKIKEG